MTAATLTAEDVRRLVMKEHWCFKHSQFADECIKDVPEGGIACVLVAPLFTRCPKCQPEGLQHAHDDVWLLHGRPVEHVQVVIDLILMSTAQDGTATQKGLQDVLSLRAREMELLYWQEFVPAIMHCNFPGAIAARHRLKDLQETK